VFEQLFLEVPARATGELPEAVWIAARTVFTPRNLAFLTFGTLFGLLMGVLPGLGGPVALALLIPVTFRLEANVSIMILSAALGGVAFGGSVTAILFNTPGDAPNAATLLDGYPLTRRGRGAEALTASAVASAAGAIVGLALLVFSIPLVRRFALAFHSVDIFWLALFGLATVAVVCRGGILANLIAGAVGLLIAFHGLNPVTGTARFTWGTVYLRDGVPLVPLIIGVFAVAEMLRLASEATPIVRTDPVGGGKLAGAKAVFGNGPTLVRSSIIGWLIGVIPGAGGTVANFVSYLQARATSADPESFGSGDIRGVIASEAANDAKDGGSMVPTLGLGIPGSASTAVLLGALVINGIVPGPALFRENLQVVFVVVFALFLSNLLTSAVGALSAERISKLARIPTSSLVPVVLAVALLGAFVSRGNFGDVVAAAAFGLFGFLLLKFGVSRVPIVIAFVLGPIAEQNFHRTLQISRGELSAFFDRPISLLLLLATALVLAFPFVAAVRRGRGDPGE